MDDLKFLGSMLICYLLFGVMVSGLLSFTFCITEFIENVNIQISMVFVGVSLSLAIPFATIFVLAHALTRNI